MGYPLVSGASIALVVNSIVTWMLWRNRGIETNQKLCQTFLIWLIPGLGAFIVYWIVSRCEQKPLCSGKGYSVQGEEGDNHFSGAG